MIIDFSNRDLYNYVYIPILKDKKRYIFLMWGSGSWKSVFASQKEIIKSFWIKDKILCIRKVKDTMKDSVFAELKARISEWNLDKFFNITTSPMRITNKLTGSEFLFRGVDDPEKLKSVEWVARIWIEEATELTKEDFDQIDLRLRGKNDMQITCSFNPTDAEHFLNTDFRVNGTNEEQTCLNTTYKDNRFIWDEYRKVFDRLYDTNRNFYNIYAEWKRGILEGLVFENWEVAKEIPKDAELICYWLDFWYTNDPTALIGIYLFNNELYFDELIYERGLGNWYKTAQDKEKSIAWRLEILWVDPYDTIRADSSEPKSIDEIHWYSFNIKPVKKGADSIKYWINTMLNYKINITARSWNLQKEFKKYVRQKDKNGKPLNTPIDAFNHWIDAARYGCMMSIWKTKDLDVFIM